MVQEDGGSVLLLGSDLSPIIQLRSELGDNESGIVDAAFSRGGSVIYVADSGRTSSVSAVRRYDGVTIMRAELATGLTARSIEPLPDARILLVMTRSAPGAEHTGGISFHSAIDLSAMTHLAACDGRPDGIAVMRTGERAYLRCEGWDLTMVEIDLQLRRVVRTVYDGLPRGCGRGAVALSRTDGFLAATCPESGMLVLLDRITLERHGSIEVGAGVRHLAASPSSPHMLTAREQSPELALVNLTRLEVEATAALLGMPEMLAVTGDGAWGLVVTGVGAASRVTVFDMGGLDEIASVDATGASAVTTWPGIRSPAMMWH